MASQRKFNATLAIEIALILVVSAFAYLPSLSKATVYRDDWYYVMDRLIGGPGVFQEMFSIDRPARGPFFEAYYQLFGVNPLPYHLSSYLWRFLGGLGALWLFNLLWPRQRRAALFMALLFTLFPGYLRWMEGFENQPRILSACLEAFSIALTLKAISASRTAPKIAAWVGSILTGWAYLALLDFAMGMEIFRLLCVFVLVGQSQQGLSFIKKCVLAIRAWAIAALIPVGFLFWRVFIFHNLRKETDIGQQLSYLADSPLLKGGWWLTRLFQSTVNVAFLSWGASPFQRLFDLRLSDIAIGMGFAALSIGSILFANHILDKEKGADDQNIPDPAHHTWQTEAISIGLIGVVMGVLPIVMANRYINFDKLSHYALPASLASAVLVVGLVYSVNSNRIRLGLISALVFSAMLTHYAVSTQILEEEQIIGKFWQQVAWRAPGIRQGTTLVVSYPGINYGEDTDAASGPANFIYFPGQTNQIPVTYELLALPQMSYTTKDILAGGKKSGGYRTHIGKMNFDNVLVLSQPSEGACVHVINQKWPLFSTEDRDQILLIGPRSKIENVLSDKESPKLAESMFGPEPAHQWCYYFEKADLALQMGDWEKVAKLGNEAIKLKVHPIDWVEWTPFLQAYAYLGDEQAFISVANRMNRSAFARQQACDILTKMQKSGYSFAPQIQTQTNDLLCNKE